MKNNSLFVILTGVFGFLLLIMFVGIYGFGTNGFREHMSFGTMKNSMMSGSDYSCCLKSSCSFCLTDPKHNGVCDCMDDVVTGEAPCSECIGQILSGNGNQYLSKYYAQSISEKIGDEYLLTLKQIVSQKYDVSIDEQY